MHYALSSNHMFFIKAPVQKTDPVIETFCAKMLIKFALKSEYTANLVKIIFLWLLQLLKNFTIEFTHQRFSFLELSSEVE